MILGIPIWKWANRYLMSIWANGHTNEHINNLSNQLRRIIYLMKNRIVWNKWLLKSCVTHDCQIVLHVLHTRVIVTRVTHVCCQMIVLLIYSAITSDLQKISLGWLYTLLLWTFIRTHRSLIKYYNMWPILTRKNCFESFRWWILDNHMLKKFWKNPLQ